MQQFEDILNYIPQRPPFVMVDKLIFADQQKTLSIFKIKPDNLFCENGVFYEAGLIENIAQTIAAGAGYRNKRQNKEPEIGFIGSIKKLEIIKRPIVDEILKTEVNLISKFEGALIAEGMTFVNDELVVSCQMNIFIMDNLNLQQP
ncbi:MAG: hydroxymyristoyl-ACP dehydratase [Bacteroidales bacterium]|nr:hydroxymyristoyl-ACP dehydratase [Bacteroidales bacterium]